MVSSMTVERDDQYFVKIDETLVGRRAGGSATEKARELRTADPIGVLTSRILRRKTDERAWSQGAHGEQIVGWFLGHLPEGWHVFHDVPVGERGANIDHVVVSRAGVFTLNTKNLRGRVSVSARSFRVNGYARNYLHRSVHEAERASRLLGAAVGRAMPVRGVLVVIADDIEIAEQPSDVYVGSPRDVKRWLERQPRTLSPAEIIEIAAAAHKPATWSDRADTGGRCPCGGTVVRRTRRADGEPFLGCSRFPACRRTWPVAPSTRSSIAQRD
jgi:hypothetical protein